MITKTNKEKHVHVLVHKKVGNSIYLCMYVQYSVLLHFKILGRISRGPPWGRTWGRIGRIIHNSSNDKSKETRFFFSFLVTFASKLKRERKF